LRKINYIIIILFCLFFGLIAQDDLPEKPISWVSDYTNLLSKNQERILNNKLDVLEKETSTQIYLAIFDKINESYYLISFTVKI